MTNQAGEDNLGKILETLSDSSASRGWLDCSSGSKGVHPRHDLVSIAKEAIQALIRTEKLKLLDEVDKSMPTAEQLATKYGYHMPEKQYGYKLALHDIREVLTKLEAEL